ncbi:MAG: bifunctional nuclease family protein [Gemmatimonadaceae bacterium]|nr:bifunctional nuclease family protein [Gemmatimonadaceae bacterium]
MIPVKVAKLGLDSVSNTYVVVLQEEGGERMLPIWIGRPEAESIAMQLNGVKRERPLTHDLCQSLIAGLGATLRRVQVTRLEKSTFYAELHLVRVGAPVIVDARPSDAIAIALRLDAPIFVDETLFAGEEDEGTGTPAGRDDDALTAEQLQRHLEHMRPEDFGRFSL